MIRERTCSFPERALTETAGDRHSHSARQEPCAGELGTEIQVSARQTSARRGTCGHTASLSDVGPKSFFGI